MKKFIREGYERGGVITISWHLNNPLQVSRHGIRHQVQLHLFYLALQRMNCINPGDKVADFMLSLKDKMATRYRSSSAPFMS